MLIHLVHDVQILKVRQVFFSFDQVAIWDTTAGGFIKDSLGCRRTWASVDSAIGYLRKGKLTRFQAWKVRRPNGNITQIRCESDINK
jgi:hypothetical protein